MTDSQVSVVRQPDGTNRWGMSKFLYRQEGNKLSLNGKFLIWILGTLFLFGTIVSLFMAPNNPIETKNRRAVDLTNIYLYQGTEQSDVLVEIKKPTQSERKSAMKRIPGEIKYTGAQVYERKITENVEPGTMVRAKIISGTTDGPIRVVLIDPLVLNGETIMPIGTKFSGVAQSSNERLQVRFKKFQVPDQKQQAIQALAFDIDDKSMGLKGKTVSRRAAKIAASVGLNVLGGLAESAIDRNPEGGRRSLEQSAMNGISSSAMDQSQDYFNDLKDSNVVQVQPGSEILVYFEGE